jgi:hypothetical protein
MRRTGVVPGVHCDVGGGFKIQPDPKRDAVSEISLYWMISRLRALTKIEIAMPKQPLAGKPAKPHDYFGWFVFSRLAPTYRLIREAPLAHRLKRPHHYYTLPPPDHPYKEYLHVSALDLLAAAPKYRPPNLLSAVKRQLALVDYEGRELPRSEVEARLKCIHHA